MNVRTAAVITLAVVLSMSPASAAEAVWPKDSASDLSIFVTLLRFRIHADHCSATVPRLRPRFEGLLEDVDRRVQGISKGLLTSDAFIGMKDKPVPTEIIDAFKDSFDDTKHNFERKDADSICPTTLQRLGDIDDESLKAALTETLTAVQNMIRNLESEGDR